MLTELKNGIEILVDQAIFKLWIKTVKLLFGSLTQEPLGLPKFLCYFLRCLDNLLYNVHIFLKDVDNFEMERKMKTCMLI